MLRFEGCVPSFYFVGCVFVMCIMCFGFFWIFLCCVFCVLLVLLLCVLVRRAWGCQFVLIVCLACVSSTDNAVRTACGITL